MRAGGEYLARQAVESVKAGPVGSGEIGKVNDRARHASSDRRVLPREIDSADWSRAIWLSQLSTQTGRKIYAGAFVRERAMPRPRRCCRRAAVRPPRAAHRRLVACRETLRRTRASAAP